MRTSIREHLLQRLDYAVMVKHFATPLGQVEAKRRYSPAPFIGVSVRVKAGNPRPDRICTSHIERQNLSVRMGNRRFTRLTNAFSKKLENHEHAVALYFMYYNFARIHQSLSVTSAMEAGIADHVWSLEEVIGLVPGL